MDRHNTHRRRAQGQHTGHAPQHSAHEHIARRVAAGPGTPQDHNNLKMFLFLCYSYDAGD